MAESCTENLVVDPCQYLKRELPEFAKKLGDTLTAKNELPGIVGSLFRASCLSLQSYRFPSGVGSQTHGFDGVAEVIEGNVFVPTVSRVRVVRDTDGCPERHGGKLI